MKEYSNLNLSKFINDRYMMIVKKNNAKVSDNRYGASNIKTGCKVIKTNEIKATITSLNNFNEIK